jgi:hypothetical protein
MSYKETFLQQVLPRIMAQLPEGASFNMVGIGHDSDCPKLLWNGPCNCEPDFYFNGKKLRIRKAS